MTPTIRSRSGPRRWAALAVLVVLLAGCGDGGSDGDPKKEAAKLLEQGLAAQVRGDVDSATDSYREVLEKDPQNKWAFYNLGLIDQQSNRGPAAEANYRRALVVDPNFPPALFNLAILRTPTAPAEAVDLYRRVIAAKPEDASAHLNLGYVLRSQGDQAGATAEIDRALELDPKLAVTPPGEPGP